MIRVVIGGSTQRFENFLQRMLNREQLKGLEKYGPQGVAALAAATPVDDSDTAHGWYYEIEQRPGYYAMRWCNSAVVEPGTIPIAVLIQYGHATRHGGFVQGRDYINPALRPIFDQMAADMWKEVIR